MNWLQVPYLLSRRRVGCCGENGCRPHPTALYTASSVRGGGDIIEYIDLDVFRESSNYRYRTVHARYRLVLWLIGQVLFFRCEQGLNTEIDLRVYLGSMCTAVLIGWDPRNPPPPSPHIWAHIRGRYWSAKTDDVSLWPPLVHVFKEFQQYCI